MLEFVDANVILRAVTEDDLDQQKRARNLFRHIEDGAATVTTSEGVLAEVVGILSSKNLFYWPRQSIADYVSALLNLNGVKIPNKTCYLRALELYVATSVDF